MENSVRAQDEKDPPALRRARDEPYIRSNLPNDLTGLPVQSVEVAVRGGAVVDDGLIGVVTGDADGILTPVDSK